MKLSQELLDIPNSRLADKASRLEEYADRMTVLAVKWVDAGHHDWPEIKQMIKDLDERVNPH